MVYLIITYGRTGSNALGYSLAKIPEIIFLGEPFHKNSKFYTESCKKEPLKFIRKICNNFKCCGCKIITGYHTQPELEKICSDNDIKRIFLYRKNNLKTALSDHFSALANNWNDYSKSLGNIKIDTKIFSKFYEKKKSQRNLLLNLYNKFNGFIIEYSELGDKEKISNLLRFLDIYNESNVKRIINNFNPKRNDMSRKIVNLKELEKIYNERY